RRRLEETGLDSVEYQGRLGARVAGKEAAYVRADEHDPRCEAENDAPDDTSRDFIYGSQGLRLQSKRAHVLRDYDRAAAQSGHEHAQNAAEIEVFVYVDDVRPADCS